MIVALVLFIMQWSKYTLDNQLSYKCETTETVNSEHTLEFQIEIQLGRNCFSVYNLYTCSIGIAHSLQLAMGKTPKLNPV